MSALGARVKWTLTSAPRILDLPVLDRRMAPVVPV